MGYYIRILGVKSRSIGLHDLEQMKGILLDEGIDFDYEIEGTDKEAAGSVTIRNKKGEDIAQLFIDTKQSQLLDEEIDEFKESIEDYVPQQNYDWLTAYLDRIEAIYAFQVLSKGFEAQNWDIIYGLHGIIWNGTGGIWQSDEGQFSNEEGSVIMADWDEDTPLKDIKGTQVALLEGNNWATFEINSKKDLIRFITGKTE